MRPPWDGGYIWQQDSLGRRWIATANEGLGASVWWPNKDYLADEPDSQRIAITVPDSMIDVSNGRLRNTTHNADGTTTYEWFVADPINNYDVAVNAGTVRALDRHVQRRERPADARLLAALLSRRHGAECSSSRRSRCSRASSTGSDHIRGTRTATS